MSSDSCRYRGDEDQRDDDFNRDHASNPPLLLAILQEIVDKTREMSPVDYQFNLKIAEDMKELNKLLLFEMESLISEISTIRQKEKDSHSCDAEDSLMKRKQKISDWRKLKKERK